MIEQLNTELYYDNQVLIIIHSDRLFSRAVEIFD